MGRKRVLAYCDAPTCATGFGTVSRNVFEGIYKTGRYDIDVLGINYWGDPHEFPYRIWPTGTNSQKDPYGRQKVFEMIPQMDFDIIFFLQDTFIMNFIPKLLEGLKVNRKTPFKTIVYYPIDSIIKEEWAKNIAPVDTKVAYCQFGVDRTKEVLGDEYTKDLTWIPHGVNLSEYYPIDDERLQQFKKQYFGDQADKFIITNLNRNQQRKDIPRTIMAFKEFRKIVPDSVLYLHMAMQDQGWNLPEVAKLMGFTSRDIVFPQNFGPNQGYPREIVNMLYNCSDVIVSTTLGEGLV
jgi:glycosyltransferase involved in cell wall biosynthesis